MATTRLSLTATPGRGYSFSAKTAATGTHTGSFTELSVSGVPGGIHSFSAKDPAASPTGPHTGRFTELSVIGVPGGLRAFSAKSPVTPTPAPPPSPPKPVPEYGGGGEPPLTAVLAAERLRETILQDERDMLDILNMVIASGVLD